jgi:hypothetical protein
VLKEGEAKQTLLHPTRSDGAALFSHQGEFLCGVAVSRVSASTGVLATAADPCSNFTVDNAAAKSMV